MYSNPPKFAVHKSGKASKIIGSKPKYLSQFNTRMSKNRYINYNIRKFQCPDCGGFMYAAKRKSRKTVPGHQKYLYCPFCKGVKNFTQVE